MNILWYIALMLVGGLCFGRLAKLVKLPNVTGYLVAGLILGPYLLKIIPSGIVSEFSIIADVALGFIAFSVGSEFKLSYIKQVGMTPVVIACLEALFATVFVTGGMLAIGKSLAFSLMMGAIAAATAPAATVMVIRQYKAKGPVTQTLLTVVALDDAAALMLFGIASAIAVQLTNPTAGGNILFTVAKPIYEIVCALLLGGALGLVLMIPLRFFKKESNRLSIIIATVFIAVSLAQLFNFSALLVCMATGGVFINLSSNGESVLKITDGFTPPILMLFFVLSGAQLDITILPAIGVVGVVYVIVRVVGKYIGAWFGGKIMKAPSAVQKYLGPALIPQAGVAIGLSLLATTILPEYGGEIRAVVLCATFVYEIIGPVVTKISLQKAGEIGC